MNRFCLITLCCIASLLKPLLSIGFESKETRPEPHWDSIRALENPDKGWYHLSIQLFDPRSGRPVDIGLDEDTKVDGYFKIQELDF